MSPRRLGTALAIGLLLAPMVVHAASFDTIVIDDNMGGAKGNGDYAVGQGVTRQEAERIAMSNCTSGGNRACKIKVTYQQCGAYAAAARTSGTGLGPTMDQASATALATCHDQTCRVIIADCVDQPLNPPR